MNPDDPLNLSTDRVQRLTPRHFRIIELSAAGNTNQEIARVLGISPSMVSKILNSPLAQDEVARMRLDKSRVTTLGADRDAIIGKARSIIEQATERAALVPVDLLDSADPRVRLQASDRILDRALGRPGENHSVATVVNITAEHLSLLTLALKESSHEILPAHRAAAIGPPVLDADVSVPEHQINHGSAADGPPNRHVDVPVHPGDSAVDG